ncbi:MAG TPA: hypothetical protein VFH73_05585, partial [Polyangia bacterium]|nr:hypothetical protein [Polyangia bacterium]
MQAQDHVLAAFDDDEIAAVEGSLQEGSAVEFLLSHRDAVIIVQLNGRAHDRRQSWSIGVGR